MKKLLFVVIVFLFPLGVAAYMTLNGAVAVFARNAGDQHINLSVTISGNSHIERTKVRKVAPGWFTYLIIFPEEEGGLAAECHSGTESKIYPLGKMSKTDVTFAYLNADSCNQINTSKTFRLQL